MKTHNQTNRFATNSFMSKLRNVMADAAQHHGYRARDTVLAPAECAEPGDSIIWFVWRYQKMHEFHITVAEVYEDCGILTIKATDGNWIKVKPSDPILFKAPKVPDNEVVVKHHLAQNRRAIQRVKAGDQAAID